MLQLITNDNFVSVYHRVLLSYKGPRVSVANFFGNLYDLDEASSKIYGPIKKLLSEEIPPIYRETSFEEFMAHYMKKGFDGSNSLQPFRL
jgi:isopenicillin N synthase-like dioxygenase